MRSIKAQNECKRIRAWLFLPKNSRLGPDMDWLQNHILKCLRCLQRFISRSKVNLALSLMKTQPHKPDLLMRANARAIGVQKHCLRKTPKARQLRSIIPEPKRLERCRKYGYSAATFTVCIVILILMKVSVFPFMDNFHIETQKSIRQYYIRQVGQDLADEIFQ